MVRQLSHYLTRCQNYNVLPVQHTFVVSGRSPISKPLRFASLCASDHQLVVVRFVLFIKRGNRLLLRVPAPGEADATTKVPGPDETEGADRTDKGQDGADREQHVERAGEAGVDGCDDEPGCRLERRRWLARPCLAVRR